jgi:hypothetical protein
MGDSPGIIAMKIKQLPPDEVPSFCWDRRYTSAAVKDLLTKGTDSQRHSTLAWILREAPMDEIWNFCTPAQVFAQLPHIEKNLGRRKELIRYILRTWHELGKF